MKDKKSFMKRVISFVSSFTILCFGMNYSTAPLYTNAVGEIETLKQSDNNGESENITDEVMFQKLAEQLALLINITRTENGLQPIKLTPDLCSVASTRAWEISVDFSHRRIDGSNFKTALDKKGINYSEAYETIACGYSDPENTMNQLKQSSAFMDIILNPSITHLGVGAIYRDKSTNSWYWEQLFITAEGSMNDEYLPKKFTFPENFEFPGEPADNPTIIPEETTDPNTIQGIDFKEYADRVVILVNQARAEAGLDPLMMVSYLADMATVRARECIGKFGHQRLDGSKFSTIIDDNLVPWTKCAENIAAGSATPEDTFEQWRNSPKHWAAIMNPAFTYIGVGVGYERNSIYKWYWEQLFVKADAEAMERLSPYIPSAIKPIGTGDMTGDGCIDGFDFILLLRYIKDPKNVYLNDEQLKYADVMQDGQINLVDAAYLQKYLLGSVKAIPVKLF